MRRPKPLSEGTFALILVGGFISLVVTAALADGRKAGVREITVLSEVRACEDPGFSPSLPDADSCPFDIVSADGTRFRSTQFLQRDHTYRVTYRAGGAIEAAAFVR